MNKAIAFNDIATFNSNIEANKTTTFNSNVIVNKPITFNDVSRFNSNVIINSPLEVNELVTFNSNIEANMTATFNSNVIMNNILDLKNKTTLYSNLEVNDSAVFNSNVNFQHNAFFESNIIARDHAIFLSNVTVSNNASIIGNLQVGNGIGITGVVTLKNDLIVDGDIITKQSLVITGVQVASGASYCNGDLSITNYYASNFPLSNAPFYLKAKSGLPMISMTQNSNEDRMPFEVFQAPNGDAYILNTTNTVIASRSPVDSNITLSNFVFNSNGFLGVGMSDPRQGIDIFQGNVNAQNIMRLKRSTNTSNMISISLNWTSNVAGAHNAIILKTLQQYNSDTLQGIREQEHKINISPSFGHTQQVAKAFGDRQAFAALNVSACNVTPTSIAIQSVIQGSSIGVTDLLHELDVHVMTAPYVLGHVWLS